MAESIFDSKAEKKIYNRLTSLWTRYVDIYPQIPVRKVIGYDKLRTLQLNSNAIGYLLKTEFDFVVCEKTTDKALLAIEFDGVGSGFSCNGKYIIQKEILNDPYRKLKLDTKLRACELSGMPLVIISFPETQLINESNGAITILDAIIGNVRAFLGLQELINLNHNSFSEVMADDPTGEMADYLFLTLEVQSDIENNPIGRKTREMFRLLPITQMEHIEMLKDRPGYIGSRKIIRGGFKLTSEYSEEKILLSTSIYVRELNCIGCNSWVLADCIAEYCLAKQALEKVGTDPNAWQKLSDETPWTIKKINGFEVHGLDFFKKVD